jgi:hypothetical protein
MKSAVGLIKEQIGCPMSQTAYLNLRKYRLNAAKRLLTRYCESLVRAQPMTFAIGSSGAAVACSPRPT